MELLRNDLSSVHSVDYEKNTQQAINVEKYKISNFSSKHTKTESLSRCDPLNNFGKTTQHICSLECPEKPQAEHIGTC